MTERKPRFEYKTVTTLDALVSRTRAQFEEEGWEVVSEEDVGILRTRLTYRRQVKSHALTFALGLGGLALVGLGLLVISGLLGENGGNAKPAQRSNTPRPHQSASVASTPSTNKGTPEPTPSSTSSSCGPTSGTWSDGDVGFEQPYYTSLGRTSEWRIRLQGLPDCTDGAFASTFVVEHVKDNGNEQTIPGDFSFASLPGDGSRLYDESYGTETTVKCLEDRPPVGSSTTCRVSFFAPFREIPNSYWSVSGTRFAAWPGQIP